MAICVMFKGPSSPLSFTWDDWWNVFGLSLIPVTVEDDASVAGLVQKS